MLIGPKSELKNQQFPISISNMKIRSILLLLFLSIGTLAIAKQVPPKPNPPRLVNDYARMLNAAQLEALERKLVAYNDSTSTQIAIVTERSLEGDDDFDYALRIYNSWNIGQEDANNGVLVFIALEDRAIRIITGYGAEGFLPDALAKRIIENVIKPAFRSEDYYGGLDRATDIIMQLGSGEYTADDMNDDGASKAEVVLGLAIFIIILIFFVFIIVAAARSKYGDDDDDDDGGYWRGGRYDEGKYRRRGGGWIFIPGGGGGSNWSGGGGGGFGGGGFGGFGGGFSGGGGAGGSW